MSKFFDNLGNSIGNEINILSVPNLQFMTNSNVCYIGDDNFLILYDLYISTDTYTFGKVIKLNTAVPINGIQLSPFLGFNVYNSGCTLIADKKIVIMYISQTNIRYRIFKNDFNVFMESKIVDNSTTNKLYNPTLINLNDGGFLIGWEERDRDGSGLGVFYKSFDKDGNEKGSTMIANTFTYKDQKQIIFAQLKNLSILVAFSSYGDGDGNGIYYDFIINCPENRFIDSLYNNRCSLMSCKDFINNCKICPSGFYSLEPDPINCINTIVPDNYLKNPSPAYGYFPKCLDICATCENTIDNCKTCKSLTAKLVQSTYNRITCLEDINGYYLPTGKNIYQKCPVYCSTCFLDTYCITCINNYNLAEISSGNVNCINDLKGYYLPIGKLIYQKCSFPCLTCYQSNNNCQSCEVNYSLATKDKITFSCIIDKTGYVLVNSLYLKCSDNCISCTSQTICTTCVSYFYLVEDNNGIRNCFQNIDTRKFYLNYYNNVKVYKPCSQICLSCINSEYNCTACNDPSKLAESSKNSLSKTCISNFEGYYYDNYAQYYKLCSLNCKTCENSENQCTSCVSGLNLILNSINNLECVKDISNYFLVPGKNYYQICDEKCTSCTENKSKCSICNAGKLYVAIIDIPNECIFKYSNRDGYYYSEKSQIFEKCDVSCNKCTLSSENCESCETTEGYNSLSDKPSTCVKTCPDNYLETPSNYICQKCFPNCYSCQLQLDNCKNCLENYFLTEISDKNFRCLKNTDGYYLDLNQNYFKKCSINCLECKDQNDFCTVCNYNQNYYPKYDEPNKCILSSQPPDGYFFDYSTKLHEKCADNCLTCLYSKDSCKECNNQKNYYANADKKYECYLETSSPIGYYFNNSSNLHEKCADSCLSCINSKDNCKECNNSLNFYSKSDEKNKCILSYQSPYGYYYDYSTKMHEKCADNCLTCFNSKDNCEVCNKEKNYYPKADQPNKCILNNESPEGYYFNSYTQIYEKCSISCLTCIDKNDYCLSCNVNQNYIENVNERKKCILNNQYPEGLFYNIVTNRQEKCAENCLSCFNSNNNCMVCNNNLNYYAKIDDINKCILKNQSPEGYYFNDSTGFHELCSINCLTCTKSKDNCINCNTYKNYFQIFNETNKCYLSTLSPDGYFFDDSTKLHEKCADNCLSCINSKDNCKECNNQNNFFANVDKKNECYLSTLSPIGYYFNNSNKLHEKCSTSCSKCKDKNDFCTVCNTDEKYFSKFDEPFKCILYNESPNGYFFNNSNKLHEKCSYICLTCIDNKDNCKECNTDKNFYAKVDENNKCYLNTLSPIGYFFNYSTKLHEKCSINCLTCKDTNENCLLCNNDLNFFAKVDEKNKCILNIKSLDGYYFNNSTKFLEKCAENCIRCEDNEKNCKECNKEKNFYPKFNETNKCFLINESPEGFYFNKFTQLHEKCGVSCLTCRESQNNCLICNKRMNYYAKADEKNNCILHDNLPSGYYFNNLTKLLEKCNESCLTCINNDNNCIECNKRMNYFAKADEKNICILKKESPEGFYFNNSNQLHEKCDETCKTCIEDSKKCLSCNTEKNYLYILEDKLNTFVTKCPDGYNNLVDKGGCKKCSKICKTCETDIKNCKTCETGLFLIELEAKNFTCSKEIEGYYLDKENKFYRKCDKSCKTCIDKHSNCLICNSDYLKKEGEEGCLDKKNIKSDEFIDEKDGKIKQCEKSCKSCKLKADSCIQCNEDAEFFEIMNEKENSISNLSYMKLIIINFIFLIYFYILF